MIIRPQLRPEPGSLDRYNRLKQMLAVSNDMTNIGWRVDRDAIIQHHTQCDTRVAEYTQKFLELSGLPREALGKVGVGQTAAVRKWFWETCGAPVVSRHKKKKTPQLNTAALVEYATQYKDTDYGPAAAALFALRKNSKYASYCDAYKALSAADGRIHSSFFPFGTKTGRWTSGAKVRVEVSRDISPNGIVKYGGNIQQVPQNEPVFEFVKGQPVKLVDSLRNIFIADEGCVVGSADFEALELRLIAYLFGVQNLIDQIDQGLDTHWTNARALFAEMKLPEIYDEKNKVHKNCRNGAKSCAYAMSYQYSEPNKAGKYPTLFKTLKATFPAITEKVVGIMAERFFALYPEIRDGQQAARATIDEFGFREIALSGRRIYYPSSMRGYNSGINLTFQSSGAELINRATLALYPHCNFTVGGFYILAQVHDELCFNIPESMIEHYQPLIVNTMGAPAQFGKVTAGIPAKLKTGKCWPK